MGGGIVVIGSSKWAINIRRTRKGSRSMRRTEETAAQTTTVARNPRIRRSNRANGGSMAATTRGIGGRPQMAAVMRQQPLLQRDLRHVDVAGEPELVAFIHQLLLACGMHASGVAFKDRGWHPLSTGNSGVSGARPRPNRGNTR